MPLLIFGVLATAFLQADVPLTLTPHRAPWLDPALYLADVRASVIAQWLVISPWFDFFPLYIYPVYAAFAMGGAGIIPLRLLSIAAVTGAMLLFLSSVRRHVTPAALAISSVFVVNYVLIMYARTGLFYGFILFWVGLSLWCYQRADTSRFYLFLSGAGAVCAMLTNFSALLFVAPFLLFLLMENARTRRIRVTFSIWSLGAGAVVILYVLAFGLPVDALYRYLAEVFVERQSLMQGTVPGFTEILSDFQLHYFFGRMPMLFTITCVMTAFIAVHLRRFFTAILWFERLAFCWLIFDVLFLALLQYRPVRYHLLLWPALLFLGIGFVQHCEQRSALFYGDTRRKRLLLLFIGSLSLGAGLLFTSELNTWPVPGWTPALILFLCGLVLLYVSDTYGYLSEPRRTILLVAIVALPLGLHLHEYHYFFASARSSTLVKAGRDLPNVVGNNALFAGPFTGPFLFESDLLDRATAHTISRTESLDVAPPTHVILIPHIMHREERVAYHEAATQYAWVKEYSFLGYPVGLLRNPEHPTYQPTAFEEGVAFFAAEQYAEAYERFTTYAESHPTQLDNLRYLAILHWYRGESGAAVKYFRAILGEEKESVAGKLNLVYVLASTGEYAEAEKLLSSIQKSVPDTKIDELADSVRGRRKPPFRGFFMFDLFITDIRFILQRNMQFESNPTDQPVLN